MEQTYEQIEAEAKKTGAMLRCKFTMVDVPPYLVQAFCSDVKSHYGNIYWVKLLDLMRKAEAYDFIMGDNPPVIPLEEKEDIKPKDEERIGIDTLGGFIPMTKRDKYG